jgi:demethylmenaquinone methyltransferase/2-methoxy-6-polyprenyl-1,4-benzoquinol methylase
MTPTETGAVWTRENLSDPHAAPDKPERVRRMFDAIAPTYDLNNRLHSLGLDQRWRKFAVREAGVREGEAVLDVACGTGDLTLALAATPAARVVGVDFAPEMLARAEPKRSGAPGGGKVEFRRGDAMALEFERGTFDGVTIAFGIRNVADPDGALREFARVLRPGGRVVVLEFDTPRNPIVRRLNALYCAWLMPRTATLISGDRTGAYRYLPASVEAFRAREAFEGSLAGAGFERVRSTALTLGTCVCYRGERAGA